MPVANAGRRTPKQWQDKGRSRPLARMLQRASLPEVSTLPNGLRIVTDRMDGVATASIGVWIDAGSRDEPPEFDGVAHILEHMAFKGTERRSARAIAEEIENVGGGLNAYTSPEVTAYSARMLAGDVPLAIDILGDILQHSVFDAKEFERERGVVLQEIGEELDSPAEVAYNLFQASAFPDQSIGRSVLGSLDSVRNLERDAVAAYLREHYTAPRMVLSAAGAVDHATILRLGAESLGGLAANPPIPRTPARYVGGDALLERPLEQVHFRLAFPSVAYGDPDHYAISLLSNLLGAGMSSRLFQEIREKRGLVYSIWTSHATYDDIGTFSVNAGTGADGIAELIPVLCDELVNTADTLTEEEITRTQTQMKAWLMMSLESSSGRAERTAIQILTDARPISPGEVVGQIDAVDRDAVARCARRIFSSRPTVAAVGPIGRVESYDRIVSRLTP